jgi:hypothetical protein
MPKPPDKLTASPELEGEALLFLLETLPQAEAFAQYDRLPPRLQWLARRHATGARRAALIEHHAVVIAGCR